jgi:AraC family ethanolamine operon transcriptional activator
MRIWDTVPDLCEAAHTSRRALQYAFEDLLQVSPITYLRCMRLNRARRDLLRQAGRCVGAGVGVGDVAARWGFWHLSRFAADYRHLFGELPSATLGRGNTTAAGPD